MQVIGMAAKQEPRRLEVVAFRFPEVPGTAQLLRRWLER